MRIVSTVVALCLLGLTSVSCTKSGATTSRVTVAAAASLRELLEKSAPAFEAAHPGCKLVFSFEASSTLSRQIEAGGAYDVFLSADADNVQRVARFTDAASTAPILSNTLVLVGRAGLAVAPKSPEELRGIDGKIALAGSKVPVGKYARAYLTNKNLLKDLEPRIVTADDVRASLAMVEVGSTDFAFVYLTDAKVAKKAVLLWTASGAENPGIVYVGTLITQFKTPLAEAYLRWVRGPEFLAIADTLGFLPPPKQ